MQTYVPYNAPGIGPIALVAFPDNRKDVVVSEFHPMSVNSYWSEGSRDDYRLVDINTFKVWSVPTSHPYFDKLPSGERCGELVVNELPPNTALVRGGFFCGKKTTVHVFLRPENLTPMLPSKVELTDRENSALNVIGGIKGGYRQDEFARRGLGRYGADNPVITSLASKGLVKITKTGISITTEGKNAR